MSLATWCFPGGEPTLAQLETLLEEARLHRPDWIVAVGGGSVLDVAKAGAGLLHTTRSVVEYHDGAEIETSRTPFLAVPTTAGTGSETTHVCVLTNGETGTKKSIRHPSFLAKRVFLDPELLEGCPPRIIASAGMDALAQAIESFVSRGATWFSDCAALKACALIGGSLADVFEGHMGAQAMDLLEGSFLAGIALSNARLGLVHGLAHPLGVRYHQPHGLVCAVCLLPVLEFNRDCIAGKYGRISGAMGGDAMSIVADLMNVLEIHSPFKGEEIVDRAGIVQEALASGSTAANPRPVAAEDVDQLISSLFE
jgi:alcohol dehydrogenase class IV